MKIQKKTSYLGDCFLRYKRKTSGFTLIELLVVISIIGLLSSVVYASLGSAKAKARDARRIADLNNIKTALILYYDKYNHYPKVPYAYSYGAAWYGATGNTGDTATTLHQALSEFIELPLPTSSGYNYYYDSNSGDNYQTYGLMTNGFESPGNASLRINDGGYSPSWYELGEQPSYCKNKYAGQLNPAPSWWTTTAIVTVCNGGN